MKLEEMFLFIFVLYTVDTFGGRPNNVLILRFISVKGESVDRMWRIKSKLTRLYINYRYLL